MKYDKLVRNKIPEIIKKKGLTRITHIAEDEEYWEKLKEKLREEVDEFLNESNKEELSDIFEVIDAICKFKNFDKKELEKRKLKRGGILKIK